MRFLICGWGSIGRRHFRNLLALGQDDIVFYRTGMSTLESGELNGFAIEHDLEMALSRHKPDVAIVANPTALHLDVAVPAVRAGCHLLIEKPLAESLNDLDELRQAVDEAGIQVLVGYQYRFHPGLRAVKSMLDDGNLGDPVSVRVEWGEYLPDWHPWEDYRKSYSARRELGGGVLLTLSHPFDYLRWLFGDVELVTGESSSSGTLDLDVEDVADIQLQFTDGLTGNVHLDYLRKPPEHFMELTCTGGSLRWSADSSSVEFAAADREWESRGSPRAFKRNDLFMEEIEHLIAISNGEAVPVCTLEDGMAALEIALLARKSLGAEQSVGVSSG